MNILCSEVEVLQYTYSRSLAGKDVGAEMAKLTAFVREKTIDLFLTGSHLWSFLKAQIIMNYIPVDLQGQSWIE